jgi:hypothetical protein
MATRKISGAALFRRIEKQLREEWLNNYGLPLNLYSCKVQQDTDGITQWATFTHRDTGAVVECGTIWTSDDGSIMQAGPFSLM